MPVEKCPLLFTQDQLPHFRLAGQRSRGSSAWGELVVPFATLHCFCDWVIQPERTAFVFAHCLAMDSACTFYKTCKLFLSARVQLGVPLSGYLGEALYK